MSIVTLVKKELERILVNIDAGNSNISEEEGLEILDILSRVSDEKLSKYQVMKLLNCSRSSFDELVRRGDFPKGKKQQGFKELFWYKKDILKYIDSRNLHT